MKKMDYIVTLWLVVNPLRDADLDNPQTKTLQVRVKALTDEDALELAINSNNTGLSVYESVVTKA